MSITSSLRAGAQHSLLPRVLAGSLIGTTIEWYDFFLYGTAAALVFNKLFFPHAAPLVGTLAALGTYAVGFVARPFGGALFGHFGDRIGRKATLVASLLVTGSATVLVGLMPTYNVIGLAAPILLVVLRFCQGLGVGGEWGGAVLMAVEHAPARHRGVAGSWPQIGVPAGLLLATSAFWAVNQLPEPAFLSWGWRLPFLLGGVLVVAGLIIRLGLAETPVFQAVKDTGGPERRPLLVVVREQPREVLLATGLRISENVWFYLLTVFVLTYATKEVGVSRSDVLTGVLVAGALELVMIPVFGAWSDRVGRKPLFLAGTVFELVFALPFFWLVDTGSAVLVALAITVALNLGHAAQYGPEAAWYSELFGSRVRYCGTSLGYQLASVFAGALSPIIAVALLAAFSGNPLPVAVYAGSMSVVSLVAIALTPETAPVRTPASSLITRAVVSGRRRAPLPTSGSWTTQTEENSP